MVCFILKKPRVDLVAILSILTLTLLGILPFEEAISGFSNPVVLIIVLMFVISDGLMRTGVSYRVGTWILHKSGRSVTLVMVYLMIATVTIGSFMSTTAVVAIFLPIALNIASRLKISAAKILMPLAYAGIISGMTTLVGTSPNLVIAGALVQDGHESFHFFDFTPIGATVFVAGLLYMLWASRFLGNTKDAMHASSMRKNLNDFVRDYSLSGRDRMFEVKPGSPLIGKRIRETRLREDYLTSIICIDRRIGFSKVLRDASPDMPVQLGDVLFVDKAANAPHSSAKMCEDLKLEAKPLNGPYFTDRSMEVGMAEISMPPESSLIDMTLVEADFRSKHGLNIVGIRRNGKPIADAAPCVKLKMGDTLLIAGPWKNIRRLKSERDFLVLSVPAELDDAAYAPQRAPFALLSIVVMVALMISGAVSNPVAALIACVMMVLFKCIDMESAYKAIHWPSVLLIVGMMPFATALGNEGAIGMVSDYIVSVFGHSSPRVMLAVLFALTAFSGLFIANTVNAILLAPLALGLAETLGCSPYPFAMTVAIACSTVFMTPISSPVNMLVWEPGRYNFSDFMKLGVPFALIVMAISITLIPILFPF